MQKSARYSKIQQQCWCAQLELGFEQRTNRTVMTHRRHFGPVRVQKMLWPEKTGVCHAIIVHPPAGIAGGDHITFKINVKNQAHAVITTPGAGKWYKTSAKTAYQHIDLNVDQQGILEWLPQETMLFDGAIAESETRIHLHQHASFIGWDMLVIGRQARQENFNTGLYCNNFQLFRDNMLLVSDRLRFSGKDRFLSSCLGMNGKAVMGSFWAVAPIQYRSSTILEQQLERIRELMMRMDLPIHLTILGDVICARFLGDDVRQCHDAFAAIRARLRFYWYELDEEFPRIWRT
ncbi:urease accessory protein UreD [Acinetobacter qingfengensis]|uniref:Urease accessory protein UreD n=1 Tax=Acinetobacter qingfengensis TaxID=1262585 RepID=A0A1E7RCU8_9GAMM|nr:urease accessory protein UreD [Acinetobacter qingfengensis]KAA8734959.1 urease accessory protein UreD [Acinetobacter qingfengensis]OEY97047.1 Urease accessory protein UreD [Acinetobacter qingfengensis]